MRFMILVKATRDSEAGAMPPESLFAEMGKYHEELQKAGMLLDASGLKPSSRGWRIEYDGKKRSFVDGFPNPAVDGVKCQIEVREFYELEDFAQSEEVERFRKMEIERKAARK